MDKKVTHLTYEIKMTPDEFEALGLVRDGDEKGYEVFKKLMGLAGVYDVEFNGHFGPVIMLMIAKRFDNEQTWIWIWEILGRYKSGSSS